MTIRRTGRAGGRMLVGRHIANSPGRGLSIPPATPVPPTRASLHLRRPAQ